MGVLFFSLAPEAPPALETLHDRGLEEHSLRLHWQPVPGARGFRLRWRPEVRGTPVLRGGLGITGRGAGSGVREIRE